MIGKSFHIDAGICGFVINKKRKVLYRDFASVAHKKNIFDMTEKQIRAIPGLKEPMKTTVVSVSWKNGKKRESRKTSHTPLSEFVISMGKQEKL